MVDGVGCWCLVKVEHDLASKYDARRCKVSWRVNKAELSAYVGTASCVTMHFLVADLLSNYIFKSKPVDRAMTVPTDLICIRHT